MQWTSGGERSVARVRVISSAGFSASGGCRFRFSLVSRNCPPRLTRMRGSILCRSISRCDFRLPESPSHLVRPSTMVAFACRPNCEPIIPGPASAHLGRTKTATRRRCWSSLSGGGTRITDASMTTSGDGSSGGGTSRLSMGLDTYRVPVKDLFVANRRKLVRRLREAGGAVVDGGLVFLAGGPSAERFDTDHEPVFRQESYFHYLTGVREPDCLVLIDLAADRTTLFVPRLPVEYATFMGRIKVPDEWRATYCVDDIQYTDEAIAAVESRLVERRGDGRAAKVLLLQGRNTDSGRLYEAPPLILEHFSPAEVDTATLFPVLAECRVVKCLAERSLLRHVTEVTSLAHVFVMQNMRAGMMEYQAESLFRHYCYYHFGCRLVGYTPICGCGPNSAVLHYGHAGEPNARQIRDGDICLFDMGAEYFGYGSDVTCSFPISGVFDSVQRTLYSAVLKAQIAVYDMIRPGVSYVDCHKRAEACILQGLVEIGAVIPGDKTVEELVEMRLGAVFMPHGLGHFIGIDTHDVGGYLDGHPSRSTEPGLAKLRTARILQEGMTLTVEPGCYFIDHLLNQALGDDSPLKAYLDSEKLNGLRGFGGIRLEDVVIVTDLGCINYTLCPRTIAEVESVMAGSKWPPMRDDAPELRRERLLHAHSIIVDRNSSKG